MSPTKARKGSIETLSDASSSHSITAANQIAGLSGMTNSAIAAFQLRLKGLDEDAVARAAEPLQKLCAERDVAFIVNDSMALAKRLGADGVHLGQGDGDPKEARRLLGPSVQIGVTCHDSRHLAMEAGEAGADYVAFGAFYPTTTKETHYRPDPSILGWWTELFELPCVAQFGRASWRDREGQ